jgi:hypothetical protein
MDLNMQFINTLVKNDEYCSKLDKDGQNAYIVGYLAGFIKELADIDPAIERRVRDRISWIQENKRAAA